ncbi:MAG: aminoacetone oxidase family FAD-binding enzyme [Clostridia bacterium]|nr:aminoacetone oxidase family FAD-binding enzyme [Clostridia bacterium]
MQKIYEVLIVGGGASGVMAAVELVSENNAINGENVIILEKSDRLLKKLSVTGNGQGNITNAVVNDTFYHGDKNSISNFLDQLDKVNLIDYLSKKGIFLSQDSRGRFYPLSRQASAVSDLLRNYISNKNVNVKLSTMVDGITFNGKFYVVTANGENYFAQKVIFAVGGKAAKHFGTDGSSYSILFPFKHKIGALYPSLVQLKAEKSCIKGLSGIKETALVVARDGEKVLKTAKGDLLFTDYGVSGSTIFEVSGHLITAEKPNLLVSFLPEIDNENLTKIIQQNINVNGIEQAYTAIINKKLGQKIFSTISKKTAENLSNAVKNYNIEITGSLGFDYAQVTKGGFNLSDVNAKTYESKLAQNLYLIGECLDVDGDCGGYNLTFAFISAIISARNVKNSK